MLACDCATMLSARGHTRSTGMLAGTREEVRRAGSEQHLGARAPPLPGTGIEAPTRCERRAHLTHACD